VVVLDQFSVNLGTACQSLIRCFHVVNTKSNCQLRYSAHLNLLIINVLGICVHLAFEWRNERIILWKYARQNNWKTACGLRRLTVNLTDILVKYGMIFWLLLHRGLASDRNVVRNLHSLSCQLVYYLRNLLRFTGEKNVYMTRLASWSWKILGSCCNSTTWVKNGVVFRPLNASWPLNRDKNQMSHAISQVSGCTNSLWRTDRIEPGTLKFWSRNYEDHLCRISKKRN